MEDGGSRMEDGRRSPIRIRIRFLNRVRTFYASGATYSIANALIEIEGCFEPVYFGLV